MSNMDNNAICLLGQFSANKHMLKFNNRSTTRRCEICLKLIIRAPKRLVSTVDFEQVNGCCVIKVALHKTQSEMEFRSIIESIIKSSTERTNQF